MNKAAFMVVGILCIGLAYFYYDLSSSGDKIELVACTLEARQCPDGSSVGREGLQCEFRACPPVGIFLNQAMTFGDTSITPLRVIEDSRCPADVECIWAGTFVAEVKIESPDAEEVRQLSIGDTVQTSLGAMVLEAVAPEPVSAGQINTGHTLFFVEE